MTKYRGLRLDGKGRVEGYYVAEPDLIVMPHAIYSNKRFYEIHPESLSLFTGLTDKNGKEIYGSINGSKGGDVLTCYELKVAIIFEAGQFVGKCLYNKMTSELQNRNWLQFEIIGNQYELTLS